MKFLPVLLLLIPVITASDGQEPKEPHHEEEKAKEVKAKPLDGNTKFAVTFFKQMTSESSRGEDSPPKNLVMSPLSISSAFAMLLSGARSQTHREIREGLSLNHTDCKDDDLHQDFSNLLQKLNEPKSSLQLDVGNAVFMDDKVEILKSFEDDLQNYYHAEVKREDFSDKTEVENKINEYVKDKTKGKIEEAFKGLADDAKMVMLNYVYFKGEWEKPFHPDATRSGKFHVNKDTTVDVEMMHRTGVYNTYHDTQLPCTVVELPYKDNASMIIVMAEPGKIPELVEALSDETLQRWRAALTSGFIEYSMPKLSMSSSMELEKELPAMGFKTTFTDLADFSGITKGGGLKVGKATHKATLNVNEHGTEAAAVTTIEMVPTALFPAITINKPFISIIMDRETESVLFMASVMNPVEK